MIGTGEAAVKSRAFKVEAKTKHAVDHSTDVLRDAPLGYYFKADFAEYRKTFDLPFLKPRQQVVVASLLAHGISVATEGLGRRVSYSRSKDFYASSGRYEGTEYTYATVLEGVQTLVDAGLFVDHHIQLSGNKGSGTQSSYLPVAGLSKMPVPGQRRMKEVIQLKDENKVLVDYRDTERTARERKLITTFNDVIADVDVSYVPLEGRVLGNGHVLMDWGSVVNLEKKELYAVYSNKSWVQGGRLYGPWWQSLNKQERARITMDGEAVVEEDYSQMHPRLMYAGIGKPTDVDAYRSIPGYTEDRRPDFKKAFHTILNAASWNSAHGSIKHQLGISDQDATDMIRAIKAAHPLVKHLFHTGLGLRLQNIDALAAKSVMTEMMVKKGVPVFPVHDSFLCPASHLDTLKSAMETAYKTALSSVPDLR
jgi:hypothetical protein